MSVAPLFSSRIEPASPTSDDIANRRWIYIPYDRFTDRTIADLIIGAGHKLKREAK